jgi:uncharacterized iron-regulated membrane protein
VLLILLLLVIVAGVSAWRWQGTLANRAPAAEPAIPTSQQAEASHHATSLNVQSEQTTPPADSTTSAPQSSQSSSSTSVQVNGQTMPLPSNGNGTVHKEITTTGGGKTTVDITQQSSSSSSTSDSSSLNLKIESKQSSINNSE